MLRRLAACAFLAAAAGSPAPPHSHVRRLTAQPLPSPTALGQPLATLQLERQLDALRQAGPVMLGGRPWRLSLAADADFLHFFLAVTGPNGTRYDPIGRPRQLVTQGQDFPFDSKTTFHVTIKPRWSDLLRASQLRLRSVQDGAEFRRSAADLLELLERRAAYFRRGDQDYYLAYVTDIDAAKALPAATRSLVFFAQRRFRSRAWRLPAAELPTGRPVRVRLGRETIVLLKRPDGLLVVYAGA